MWNNYLLKLFIVIDDLPTCVSEFRKYYFREVVEYRFAATSFIKVCNPYTYYSIALELNFMICEHTLCVVLGIRVRTFEGILESYGSTVNLEHSLKGFKYNRLSIKSFKQ